MSRLLLVLGFVLVLGGCSAVQSGFGAYGQTHAIPAGSRLTLVRPLNVPPGAARVYLQGPRAPSGGMGGVNQYDVFCRLDVNNLGPDTVQPDTFTVTRYYQETENIGVSQTPTFQRVAVTRAITIDAGGGQGGDGSEFLFFETVMDLRSANQPNVRKLVCGSWAMPWDGEYPTVTQIRRAIEPYFQVQRPAG